MSQKYFSKAEVFRRTYTRINHHKSLKIGLFLSLLVFCIAVTSLFYTPYDPYKMNLRDRFSAPGETHIFGTDEYGRDLFSRCMIGLRIAVTVGLISTSIALGFGLLIGLSAGMGFGWVDEILMRIMDGLYAFPALIFAIAIVSVFGTNIYNAMIAIGIVRVPIFARMIRNQVISLKKREFITAANSLGVSVISKIFRHYLPNIWAPVSVLISSNFAFAILSEAGLSYIGLGTQPPVPSLGRLLMESQKYMEKAPWLAIFPGLIIALIVLGFSLLSDGLNDISDPKY